MSTNGFAVVDNLLVRSQYCLLKSRVRSSWESGDDWRTRVKGPGSATKVPLQKGDKLRQIATLVDRVEATDKARFTYLFHQLHADDDKAGLVKATEEAVLSIISNTIGLVVGGYRRTSFSLTAFTPGCRLRPHTDHGGSEAYRLTVILYFSEPTDCEAPLMFDGSARTPHRIEARPNRLVIFLPSATSIHWVDRVPDGNGTARLAFSGWLI